MIQTRLTLVGADTMQTKLASGSARIHRGVQTRLRNVGFIVAKEAARNAKRGPPNRSPGALERNITFKVGLNHVDIQVYENTQAGEYAKKQHDEIKGRGPGTQAKGSRAGWKFITRAIHEDVGPARMLRILGGAFRLVGATTI